MLILKAHAILVSDTIGVVIVPVFDVPSMSMSAAFLIIIPSSSNLIFNNDNLLWVIEMVCTIVA